MERSRFRFITFVSGLTLFLYLGLAWELVIRVPGLSLGLVSAGLLALTVPFGFFLWLPLSYWSRSRDEEDRPWDEVLSRAGFVSISWVSGALAAIILRYTASALIFLSGRDSAFIYRIEGSAFTVLVSIVFTILGTWIAFRGPVLRKVRVDAPEGVSLRIAQISDLHLGTWIGGSKIGSLYLDQVIQLLSGEKFDVLVLTGDIGDGYAKDFEKELARLAAVPAPLGRFAVTGNHEYYWDGLDWMRAIERAGFQVLTNTGVELRTSGESPRIGLAGVPDLSAYQFVPGHRVDVEAAVLSISRADFKILLSHQPQVASEASRYGFDLQLSGHTHGGQMVPWSWLIHFFHRGLGRGLKRVGDLQVYIHRGTGFWGPPNRLGQRAEVALIEMGEETAAL